MKQSRRDFLSLLFVAPIAGPVLKHIKPRYNLPRMNANEIDVYNKLPFYLANMSCTYVPQYAAWEKIIAQANWQPNLGETKRIVK